jgi:methionyl-tRNA formyltransferase
MVIVFFGTPQFAVPTLEHLLASRHRVALVVTQPDKRRGRGQKVTDSRVKAAALAHNIPVYQPERLRDAEFADTLRRYSPDLGVVAAYGKLIPEELLRLPRFGMVNVHASLLPKYRGAAPVHRAVINGDEETGVTIMQVVKALDAGDMLAKSARPIDPDVTSDALERALADDGARLLLPVLDQLEGGTAHPEPQDEVSSTYAARLTKEEGLVDWSQSARQIHNRVRGLYPWPHAYTYLEGARLILLKVRLKPDTTSEVRLKPDTTSEVRLKPDTTSGHTVSSGTIVGVTRDSIDVETGDGRLSILELQPEGKRPMQAREFLSGRNVHPGMRFDSA